MSYLLCLNFETYSNYFSLLGMVVKNTEGKDITLRGILLCGTADAPAKCLMQNFVHFNGFARSKEKLWRLQVGEATHMPTHLTEATY